MKASFQRQRGARGALAYGFAVEAAPATQPLRAARMLAVAHDMQRQIDVAELKDRAALARVLGYTRARVTQLLNLLLLAPDIQEELLFMAVPPGADPFPERSLRHVVRAPAWSEQRRRWAALRGPLNAADAAS